jgi:hypothetical protein
MGALLKRKNPVGNFWTRSDPVQNPGGESDDGLEQFQPGAQGDPDEPEGEEQEPDEWVKKEGQNGDRPTNDQEDQPKQKLEHVISPLSDEDRRTGIEPETYQGNAHNQEHQPKQKLEHVISPLTHYTLLFNKRFIPEIADRTRVGIPGHGLFLWSTKWKRTDQMKIVAQV